MLHCFVPSEKNPNLCAECRFPRRDWPNQHIAEPQRPKEDKMAAQIDIRDTVQQIIQSWGAYTSIEATVREGIAEEDQRRIFEVAGGDTTIAARIASALLAECRQRVVRSEAAGTLGRIKTPRKTAASRESIRKATAASPHSGRPRSRTEPIGYTTWGPVRGCCGHYHQSTETAQRCLDADASGCQGQGGYSDRHIRAITTRADVRRYDVTMGPGQAVEDQDDE